MSFIIGFLIVNILILLSVTYILLSNDPGTAGTVVQGIAAAVVPLVGAGAWWARRTQVAETSGEKLDQIADLLALKVQHQWRTAALERGLNYPAPIPLYWRLSTLAVSGPVTDAVGRKGLRRFAPLFGMQAATARMIQRGTLHDLFRVYGGLGSGRIVILGEAGAGKSSAMVTLLLDAFAHREGLSDEIERAAVPVPVLLSVHGWDPVVQSLANWVGLRLVQDYRFLGDQRIGRDVAAKLIETGRISLFLDGLDEMSSSIRAAALQALNGQAQFRLVLATRSREMVEVSADIHLFGSVAVELLPVEGRDGADYLSRCAVQPLPAAWVALIQCLRERTNSVVVAALDSPLMLTLVRDTYRRRDPVNELMDDTRFSTRQAIEDHLILRILPTAYARRPGQIRTSYGLEQAQNWLGHIAYLMTEQNTRDLVWWLIPEWKRSVFRRAATLLLVQGSFWISVYVSGGTILQSAMGALTGSVIAFVFARLFGVPMPRRLSRVSWEKILARGNLASILAFGMAGWLLVGPIIAMDEAVGGELLDGFKGGIRVALIGGLLFGTPCGIVFGVARLYFVESAKWGGWRDHISPYSSWQDDYRWALMIILGLGLSVGFSFGLLLYYVGSFTFNSPVGRETVTIDPGVILALPFYGIAVGLAFALTSCAAWPAALSFLQLRWSNEGPLRMMRFLEDAREHRVLRISGSAYQFRHARLQDVLAKSVASNQARVQEM